ncbi:MAG TPA: porphobilinogen synthase [Candidatus Hydrogenedentes bacterium]|nr:porphobilinogen synthase [Candidatus Hydrogenedentota bacterium]HOD95261.1 porphobilinogen synthase [Candidatus Hydrogenedentota bacterium]HOM48159.1 porphobilinogen synthase [Candidatus Hydrogenedentota bacterium]HOR50432.1 porphobilinogen synthase [Candidatus Hydrogenedentota bacterium]HPK25330.1 porphobilinogen synthase [Candidatus Hydrogenedentota bacterium]
MILPDRPRRLRLTSTIRRMTRETRISVDQLIAPLFIREEEQVRSPISSMPGQYQLGIADAAEEAQRIYDVGIPAVLLFGIPEHKDNEGSSAWRKDGVIPRAVDRIKKRCPDLCVITDVCLCEYTDHGHCGIIKKTRRNTLDVDNDATVEVLVREALAHADAGADIIAPSDMMDGRIGAIRSALDAHSFEDVAIMAYSAKYASSFYGPFRDAAESPPAFGDRRSYQMDPANALEAQREISIDIAEGADIIMIKPALPYLDIIRQAADNFDVPVAAYNVSGEYAMVKAAAARGWLDEKQATLEILTGICRAGASLVITYFAQDAAKWLQK